MTLNCFHLPLRQRMMSSAPLMHQSRPMARAMPTTPMFSHSPRMKERMVRQTTVAKMEDHMVNFTSPAARRPAESGLEKGCTRAAKALWMMTMTRIRCLVSAETL